jgi:quinol monooxygenase YgiN
VIIVTGSIVARPDSLDALIDAGLMHMRRSRSEPGCLAYNMHHDVENPLRLVFVEHWADRAALEAHFRVPASGQFVAEARELAASPPDLRIYQVTDA